MITGTVKADEGRIRLLVRGPSGEGREIEAVIDTGYTGSLTLPPDVIAALSLQFRTVERGMLADGSVSFFDIYIAEIVWDGKPRRTLVAESDADPLVGMRLLRGHELKMQVRARGTITIKRLAK